MFFPFYGIVLAPFYLMMFGVKVMIMTLLNPKLEEV